MNFTNKPNLNPDGSVPGSFYDEDYWERGAESGKGSYNTNWHTIDNCVVWARDCFNRWGPFKSFLELGCGRAWNIYGFLHLPDLELDFNRVAGIDISAYAIATVHPEVRPYVRQGDITDLSDIADKTYDLIFSNDVLEHLTPEQAEKCLRACKRIARKKITHLISVGDNLDLTTGQVPSDQDQSHINLKSGTWWGHLVSSVFSGMDDGGWKISVYEHGRTFEFVIQRYGDWQNQILGVVE